MPEITLTVNGQLIKGKKGDTVLTVCRANGIDIPTLCHLEGTNDVGACRLCVVEIQGERRPTPACTYPARDGLVIQTHTPQLEKYRRQILELMFAERNHFCMFCEQSGDCELQALAYRYQMDNVRFQGLFPKLPVDTLSKSLVIDHNRCILCGRCVRACREVAGVRVLDFGGRGFQTMIIADINQSLGESSCTLCGACLQACPTGALMSKPSLYRGKTKDCRVLPSVCPGCDIGCDINVMVKDNNLVRIEAPDMTSPRGSLCRIGRFDLVSESRPRITSPMLRNAEGKLVECSLDEAITTISQNFAKLDNKYGGLISTRCTDESIKELCNVVTQVNKKNIVDTLDGADCRLISSAIIGYNNAKQFPVISPDIEGILKADCILVVGDDIDNTHPVIGTLIRRAVTQNRAKLIIINADKDVLPLWSDVWLKPVAGTERTLINGLSRLIMNGKPKAAVKKELASTLNLYEPQKVTEKTGVAESQLKAAAELLSQSENSFVISGHQSPTENDTDTVTGLLNLAYLLKKDDTDNLNILLMKQNVNSRGAWQLGIADRDIKINLPRGLYLLLSDDTLSDEWLTWLQKINFLVLQASYYSPAVETADVILPSRTWAERGGTYYTTDGRTVKAEPVLQPRFGLPADEEVLQKLAQNIKTPGRS
ncbi:MAG: molybdopterin-dependent oxidoreductase [Dehalococcoidales bacterium]|nr:molybdopterin-dependent oxidoreductase [Dehalococcoidales bacterium]